MMELIRDGVVSFGNITGYKTADAPPHIRDEGEGRVELVFPIDSIDVLSPDRKTIKGRIRQPTNLTLCKDLNLNFHALCLSRGFRRRHWADRPRNDCVVVIHNRAEFVRRVIAAVEDQLPGWGADDDRVSYYDPLLDHDDAIRAPFWKHFKYHNQMEHRIVLIPPQDLPRQDRVSVRLGSLMDLAFLFVPS
jgi:hypothetical protein